MSDTPSWPSGTTPDGPDTPDGGSEHTSELPADAVTPPPPPPPPPPAPRPGPPAAPAGATVAGAPGATAATLPLRFAARLIDALLLTAVTWFLPDMGLLLAGILGAIISLGYYVAMETSQGATVGKLVLGMTVLGASGSNPTPEESVKRNLFLAFQVVPFIGGLAGLAAAIGIAVTISQAPDNRGFHDAFAGTTVTKG